MGRTLEHDDALAVQFDRVENNANMATKQTERVQRARRRAREARNAEMAAMAAERANRAVMLVHSRRVRRRGGVGASVGIGDDGERRSRGHGSNFKSSGTSRSKRRPQSARVPSRRAIAGKSVISQRISRNPAGVACGLRSGFEVDQGRRGGAIQRHGKYAKRRQQRQSNRNKEDATMKK